MFRTHVIRTLCLGGLSLVLGSSAALAGQGLRLPGQASSPSAMPPVFSAPDGSPDSTVPAYRYDPPQIGPSGATPGLSNDAGPRMQESTRQPPGRTGMGAPSPGGRTVAPTYRYQGVPGLSHGNPTR